VHEPDPTEEVGADGCEVRAQGCEVRAGDLDEVLNASVPNISEEIYDAYQAEPEILVPSPDDGLPVPRDEGSDQPVAPPFTFETVICVGDDREWVEVFLEEKEPGEYCPGFLMQRNTYKCRPLEQRGEPEERMRFSSDRVIEFGGEKFVKLTAIEAEQVVKTWKPKDCLDQMYWSESERQIARGNYENIYLVVRPRREPCKYYKRQVLSFDGQPDPNEPGSKIVFRNCTIRRSVGGAFMSLRDEAVYACDYRDPPDPASVKRYLDEPDDKNLRSNAHKILLPLWKEPKK